MFAPAFPFRLIIMMVVMDAIMFMRVGYLLELPVG
jgi:hypothetical protein